MDFIFIEKIQPIKAVMFFKLYPLRQNYFNGPDGELRINRLDFTDRHFFNRSHKKDKLNYN